MTLVSFTDGATGSIGGGGRGGRGGGGVTTGGDVGVAGSTTSSPPKCASNALSPPANPCPTAASRQHAFKVDFADHDCSLCGEICARKRELRDLIITRMQRELACLPFSVQSTGAVQAGRENETAHTLRQAR